MILPTHHATANAPGCAVQRRRFSAGAIPARQLSLRPVAIEAAVEATRSLKPSMERTDWRFREQAGRNVRERRAGLENGNVGADPAQTWGRPLSQKTSLWTEEEEARAKASVVPPG